jgi:hypothetical protein
MSKMDIARVVIPASQGLYLLAPDEKASALTYFLISIFTSPNTYIYRSNQEQPG